VHMAISRDNSGRIIHTLILYEHFPCFPAYFNIIIAPWQSLVPYFQETAIKNKKIDHGLHG